MVDDTRANVKDVQVPNIDHRISETPSYAEQMSRSANVIQQAITHVLTGSDKNHECD